MEDVVSGHALPLQNVILHRSGCLERLRWLIADRRAVGLRTSRRQQRVGACSRPADDGIRRLISFGDLSVERTIGSLAFEPQTVVGLFALRPTTGSFIGHRLEMRGVVAARARYPRTESAATDAAARRVHPSRRAARRPRHPGS